MTDTADKIRRARRAGYSDAEIFGQLSRDQALSPQLKRARQSGYRSDEIVQHLADKRTAMEEVAGAAANFNKMIPFADEAGAAMGVGLDALTGKVRSVDDLKSSWKRQRDTQDEFADDFNQRRPNTAAMARGTGIVAGAAVPFAPGIQAIATGNRALAAGRGAVLAGSQAGLSAAADRGTLEERLGAASRVVRDPLTLGLGAAFGAAAVPRQVRSKSPNPISSEDLGAQKAAAYRRVDQSGVRYTPEAFRGLSDNILADTERGMMDPDLHDAATKATNILAKRADEGFSPTLTQVDQLRQIVRDDVIRKGGGNAKFGRDIVGSIDDFVEKAGPDAMAAGVGEDGAKLLNDARALNTRYRRTQAAEDALGMAEDRAAVSGSGGNIDNATRQRLLSARNKMEGLSKQERAAFDRVIHGTPTQNALRLVGKVAPNSGGLMAMLNSVIASGTTGVGVVTGGPLGGLAGAALGSAPGATGTVAKHYAEKMTRKNVQELLSVLSNGGGSRAELEAMQEALAGAPQVRELNGLRRVLSDRLSRAAGVQGGARQDQSIRQMPDGSWEVDINRGAAGTR